MPESGLHVFFDFCGCRKLTDPVCFIQPVSVMMPLVRTIHRQMQLSLKLIKGWFPDDCDGKTARLFYGSRSGVHDFDMQIRS
jgi:hypothetical protein